MVMILKKGDRVCEIEDGKYVMKSVVTFVTHNLIKIGTVMLPVFWFKKK